MYKRQLFGPTIKLTEDVFWENISLLIKSIDSLILISCVELSMSKGNVILLSECRYSKLYLPLSESHPWFVKSLSSPRILNILFCETFSSTEQPTEQQLHVDETFFRSHGLALNLYDVDVSAPTGQIWTVLPEKYDLKGSSGKVFTCVLFPLWINSIKGSPEISSENLVQRAHKIHLSLANKIISEVYSTFKLSLQPEVEIL